MSKPRLLDTYCCASGCSEGYSRAGFEPYGIDIKPQPHYPFPFLQMDALEALDRLIKGEGLTFSNGEMLYLKDFAAVHASPPCQDFIPTIPKLHGTAHLLNDTRQLLIKAQKPYVIENIPGAPLRADYILCGCMFNLPRLRRQRWFETSWNGFMLRPTCQHPEHHISVTGHGIPSANYYRDKLRGPEYQRLANLAMGIDWMNRDERAQAIPPAYLEYLGKYLLRAVTAQKGGGG